MNKAYIVGNEFVKVNGLAYPIKNTFVVGEIGVGNNKRKVLFPIVKKLIIQPAEHTTWLDDFTGSILECYNTMPWQSEGYGRSTGMWLKMTCAYINFGTYNVTTYDIDGSILKAETEQDEFGLCFRRVNVEGEVGLDYYVTGIGWVTIPGGGGKGAVISAATPFAYPGEDLQPETHVGTNCNFVSFYVSDSTSGSEDPREYGWLGAVFRGNCMEKELRERDMVMWFYELEYDTGFWHSNFVQGTPNDATFAPGASGTRIISNQWKYAPWSRYPHLL